MKALFFLFNIEGYGEFFSGITPYTLCACTSSAWGIFSKILHNIHIEPVT
jgi:hypothetical protein